MKPLHVNSCAVTTREIIIPLHDGICLTLKDPHSAPSKKDVARLRKTLAGETFEEVARLVSLTQYADRVTVIKAEARRPQ